jgi:hypothetical protein
MNLQQYTPYLIHYSDVSFHQVSHHQINYFFGIYIVFEMIINIRLLRLVF